MKVFPTGVGPAAVAIGDLNGDGKPDLVTGNYWSDKLQTISVLLNRGTGSFRAARTYPVGSPYSVAVGDLNGDSRRDIVTANPDTNSASVLINRGNGSFGAALEYDTGRAPSDVALGDLNGDGKLDLLTANANTISVLLNAGDGTLEPRLDDRTGRSVHSVAIGDLNHDGQADVVTANQSDVNMDGRLDVVTANHVDGGDGDSVSVLLGNADGSFQPRRDYRFGGPSGAFSSIAIGDFNHDGLPDLAIGNDPHSFVALLLNLGGGRFHGWYVHGTTREGGSGPRAIAVGDLNGDGKPDIVTPNGHDNRISVLTNTTPRH